MRNAKLQKVVTATAAVSPASSNVACVTHTNWNPKRINGAIIATTNPHLLPLNQAPGATGKKRSTPSVTVEAPKIPQFYTFVTNLHSSAHQIFTELRNVDA